MASSKMMKRQFTWKLLKWSRTDVNYWEVIWSRSKHSDYVGRGVGQVVTVLAFYSDNPISSTADVYSFFL